MKKVHTNNAPEAIGPYSQAIINDNIIYTSGQIPINPASGVVDAVGIVEQTEQVCKNIKAILEEAGSSLSNVIKTTCFLQNIGDFNEFNEVYAEYFTSKPARSCVEVAALPKGVLCEVEVIAIIHEM